MSALTWRLAVTALLTLPAGVTAGGHHTLDDVSSLPARAEGYETVDIVEKRMSRAPLHEIEGIWQLTGDGGSIIAIERIDDGDTGTMGTATTIYRMAVIVSSEISVAPGTVIGYASTSAKNGEYDSRIYSGRSEDFTALTHPSRNVLRLDDSGTRLTFRPTGLSLRFNWWRLLLPYLYRGLVTPREANHKAEEGCVRLYPPPVPPLNPRYL